MKRIISLLLICSLLLSACASTGNKTEVEAVKEKKEAETETPTEESEVTEEIAEKERAEETTPVNTSTQESSSEMINDSDVDFRNLSDPGLQTYLEDNIYADLIEQLDSDDYFVENIDAVYISQEYLDELDYNSKTNIYFGYSLSDLDKVFEGKKYIFTLNDNGETTVREFEEYYDNTFDTVVKNVTVGTGVILVCVTVSVVSAGTGAAAVSLIFACAAETGTACALSRAVICGTSAAVIEGIQTGDMEEALKAGAVAASEGYKIGAIIGAVSGGLAEGAGLYGATLNGLSMNDAAIIQKESHWPLDCIKNLHSVDEYTVYKEAGLMPVKIDHSWALVKNIDWNLVDSKGRTNIVRVKEGLAPLGPDGKPFELHHIGMRSDSPLAILTNTEHHDSKTYKIIHYMKEGKDISDAAWQKQKQLFWNSLLKEAGYK